MQKRVLEQFKANQDFVLLSPTGSGKTLAFSLLVSKLIQSDKALKTQTLIVVPTRELALQIESVIKKVITGYKVLCVYGGHDTKIEKNALRDAPSIIIALGLIFLILVLTVLMSFKLAESILLISIISDILATTSPG